MDDFTRGALEMQRVAAEAMDTLVANTEEAIRNCSKGLDHAYTWSRLKERREHYLEAATLIRSIKIQREVI